MVKKRLGMRSAIGVSSAQGSGASNVVRSPQYRCDKIGFPESERARTRDTMLRAYRYQYIGSGIETTRFPEILFGMVSEGEGLRIRSALGPLL